MTSGGGVGGHGGDGGDGGVEGAQCAISGVVVVRGDGRGDQLSVATHQGTGGDRGGKRIVRDLQFWLQDHRQLLLHRLPEGLRELGHWWYDLGGNIDCTTVNVRHDHIL